MHAIVWRFRIAAGAAEEFERHYGPGGTWARLFRRSPDYVRTDLLKDGTTYVTVDWWRSRDAYEPMKSDPDYLALDKECETLTVEEVKIGEFTPMLADGSHFDEV